MNCTMCLSHEHYGAWLQVKVFDLHGKNYGFTLLPTYQPIAEDNCVAVASKTRKNILITMQVCPHRCALSVPLPGKSTVDVHMLSRAQAWMLQRLLNM